MQVRFQPDLRVEKPGLRTPVSLMIDDSSPGEPIYSEFVEEFSRFVEETGVKGKFTVMPYTFPEALDQALRGERPARIRRLLEEVRRHIAPNFDITPEMLTHNPVVDLRTGGFVYPCVPEHIWSQDQDAETLAPYIARALQILKEVGLEATGVTSPANFGRDVEGEYARAVLEAQKQVNGRSLTWYFLHVEPEAGTVLPRLVLVDEARREAVVSITSGYGDYRRDPELEGRPISEKALRYADQYIAPDGGGGRLVELFRAGSYIIFHHHWWRMMEDCRLGFEVLREVVGRMGEAFGKGIRWMRTSEVAEYWAASECVEVEAEEEGGELRLEFSSPFPCRDFTVSLPSPMKVEVVLKEGREMVRTKPPLTSNSWCTMGGRLYICFDLDFRTTILVRGRR
ncbi:MAG: hypothetical protein DRP94_02580 [Candidatus Latescibacterota bacterium]|nr:MAG: hypothetical protein DRP94_02580 [Candidatus Latescibacterota bacterium]